MSPYLTRNRTSSTSSAKEAQSKDKTSRSKAISKTKPSVNKTSKLKENKNVIGTRSVTLTKRTRNRNNVQDSTTLQARDSTQNEKQGSNRKKKLSKENISNKSKSRQTITRGDTTIHEQEVKDKKRKISKRFNKYVSSARQMSLKESFLNQSKIKLLRSHTHSKKVKNDSTSVKETLTKKSTVDERRLPIYKCVSPENSAECSNEIYEFKFDMNDLKERLPKKRKKRAATVKKTLANNRRKSISAKRILQGAKVRKTKATTEKTQEDKKADPVESKQFKISVEPLMENEKDELEKNLVKNSNKDVEATKAPEEVIKEQTADNKVTKPIVISVNDISDKKITIVDNSRVSNSDDFRPFRPTNIFNNRLTLQQKSALNYSLFEKSLSPITKSSENSQINSPWRASPLLAFSQVRNVFQSTPQNRKYDVSNKRFVRTLNNESKQIGTPTRVKNNFQENNENISTERRITTNTPKLKTAFTSRKFGTEITNIDHSLQSNVVEQVSERIASDVENFQSPVQTTGTVSSNGNNLLQFDNNENKKQNNISSPEKHVKQGITELKSQNRKENLLNTSANARKENYDPQPGPSGLQNRSTFNEQRVLRQSDLNNFLNIMEVPQTTTIKTLHGIFDDGESIPISGRSVKKQNNPNMDLQNAFGFSDDDSNQDMPTSVPTIINEKTERASKPIFGAQNVSVARLPVTEIKNKLLIKTLKSDSNKENIPTEKIEVKKSPIKKKHKAQIDVTNFSDTFDVLSIAGDTSVASVSDIPLFADHEPSRFTQPPRHSYKRKRVVRFSFSEEESEEEKEEQVAKRRKANKLKKEQDERLMEWVNDINRTFNEIDHHELLIE